MTNEYTKYIIEGRVKKDSKTINESIWVCYDYHELDHLEDAIVELKFYRKTHKAHEFRIVKRDYVATDTILDH